MKQLYALLLGILLTVPVHATHIVGGELSLQEVKNDPRYSHRLRLNLYFDAVRGSRNAIDNSVVIDFFRKSDFVLTTRIAMPLVRIEEVAYDYPICSRTSGLYTELYVYETLVSLNPLLLNDPKGYLLVWERCCRNNAINNIVGPGNAGMAFYAEIPPLTLNGAAFSNNTPEFAQIRGDYICKGIPFSFDFSAKDADGDSLSYRIVTPLNGNATPTLTGTGGGGVGARPNTRFPNYYPEIIWSSGFDAQNSIPGNPALRIHPRTGVLTVRASDLGLFVFSVEVTEFRNGQKIGLVRRDFQLQVIDCVPNEAPVVRLREAGKSIFYRENEVIRIRRGQKKCMTFLITDVNVNQREAISVKPVRGTINFTLTPDKVTIDSPNDTIRAELCLDNCSVSLNGEPLIFDVISSDNGCPNAKSDTLRVALLVEPDPNQKPIVSTTLAQNSGRGVPDQLLTFNVNGVDGDRDSLRLMAVGQGFALGSVGMEFPAVNGRGAVTQAFKWTPKCNTPGPYVVNFLLTDLRCNHGIVDTVKVFLDAPTPSNVKPAVSTTLNRTSVELIMELTTPQSIQFNVLANDSDSSPISLTGIGRGFDMKAVGMQFSNQSGKPTLNSPFSWTPNCRMLAGAASKTFIVDFIADDVACKNRHDTLSLRLTLVDRPTSYEVAPINVFTPNNDGKNDFFSLADLPGDNCSERFERVVVYNRWGTAVFRDTSRDFRWYGSDAPAGEYFYLIEYTRRQFKGPLTLLR